MAEFKSENINKHRELADNIKSGLNVEGTTIKEKDSHSAYYSNLPTGVTQETVEDIAKYNSKFITASHVAVGELAADVFKKDKSATEVNAEIGYFGKQDTIDINVSREKTYKNSLQQDSKGPVEVTKHLVMKTAVNLQSVKGVGLKSVRESMSEEFHNSFKK